MDKNMHETALKALQDKVRVRIDAGRDPGVVLWQAALESMLTAVSPYLSPGEVVPAAAMDNDASARFAELQRILDISPFVWGVFLPSALADTLTPAEIATPLVRTAKGSMKLLLTRVGDVDRIMAAELAPDRPGIDIFEAGALLGSYEYDSTEAFMAGLSKAVWIHLKRKGPWAAEDCIRYTERWFLKSVAFRASDLPVNPNHSYIHSPTLLRLKPVDALFKLMGSALAECAGDIEAVLGWANAAARLRGTGISVSRDDLLRNDETALKTLEMGMTDQLLALLTIIRGYDIVDFNAFSAADQRAFKDAFARTVEDACERVVQSLR